MTANWIGLLLAQCDEIISEVVFHYFASDFSQKNCVSLQKFLFLKECFYALAFSQDIKFCSIRMV